MLEIKVGANYTCTVNENAVARLDPATFKKFLKTNIEPATTRAENIAQLAEYMRENFKADKPATARDPLKAVKENYRALIKLETPEKRTEKDARKPAAVKILKRALRYEEKHGIRVSKFSAPIIENGFQYISDSVLVYRTPAYIPLQEYGTPETPASFELVFNPAENDFSPVDIPSLKDCKEYAKLGKAAGKAAGVAVFTEIAISEKTGVRLELLAEIHALIPEIENAYINEHGTTIHIYGSDGAEAVVCAVRNFTAEPLKPGEGYVISEPGEILQRFTFTAEPEKPATRRRSANKARRTEKHEKTIITPEEPETPAETPENAPTTPETPETYTAAETPADPAPVQAPAERKPAPVQLYRTPEKQYKYNCIIALLTRGLITRREVYTARWFETLYTVNPEPAFIASIAPLYNRVPRFPVIYSTLIKTAGNALKTACNTAPAEPPQPAAVKLNPETAGNTLRAVFGTPEHMHGTPPGVYENVHTFCSRSASVLPGTVATIRTPAAVPRVQAKPPAQLHAVNARIYTGRIAPPGILNRVIVKSRISTRSAFSGRSPPIFKNSDLRARARFSKNFELMTKIRIFLKTSIDHTCSCSF